MLQDNRRKFRIISGCYCHFLPFPRCIVSHQYIRLADYRWLTNLKVCRSGLILVVLDDALVPVIAKAEELGIRGLNPCCAGRCSSTLYLLNTMLAIHVSILVVLDDALVRGCSWVTITISLCLNPCCAGRCSSTSIPMLVAQHQQSLNPCCAGRCSSTRKIETILIINMLQNYAKVIFAFLNQKLTVS